MVAHVRVYNTTVKCVMRAQCTLGHTTDFVIQLIRGILSTFAIDLYIQSFSGSEISIDKALMTRFSKYVLSCPLAKVTSHEDSNLFSTNTYMLKPFYAIMSVGRVC